MSAYVWSAAFAVLCLLILLALLIGLLVEYVRVGRLVRAARAEAADEACRRDHFLMCVGFNDAYALGLLNDVDEMGRDVRARGDVQ